MENMGNMRDGPAIGFKFVPTEEELVTKFLFRKSMGLPFPGFNPVVEKDLYGHKHPSDVLSDILDSPYWNTNKDHEKEMYVFTRLSKVSAGKIRIVRTTGHGTWAGQTGVTKIISESTRELIGTRKMLSFTDKKGPSSDHWIMHEFSLDGVLLNNDLKDRDYVICRITRRKERKSNYDHSLNEKVSGQKRSAVEELGDEILCCKRHENTTIIDQEPHTDMLMPNYTAHEETDVLMLPNYIYTAHEEESHDDTAADLHHTIDDIELESVLKEMIDNELEISGNVDVLSSSQEYCNNHQVLHMSSKHSQLGNSLDNDQMEGVSRNSAPLLSAQRSNDDSDHILSIIEEYLLRPDDDDGDELLQPDHFHLEDRNSSWLDDFIFSSR